MSVSLAPICQPSLTSIVSLGQGYNYIHLGVCVSVCLCVIGYCSFSKTATNHETSLEQERDVQQEREGTSSVYPGLSCTIWDYLALSGTI